MRDQIDAQALEVVVGALRYLGWIVLLGALTKVYWALTADSRASKAHGEDIRGCRDRTRQALLWPTLAQIVVVAHETVSWKQKATREEMQDRVRGELSIRVADFGQPLGDLEDHTAFIRDTDLVHDQIVTAQKRQGVALALFIPCWIVLLWWAYYGKGAPAVLPIGVGVMGSVAAGWFAAEVWRQVTTGNAFSRLKKDIDRLHVAGDGS